MSKKAKKAKQAEKKPAPPPQIGAQLGAALRDAGLGKLEQLKAAERAQLAQLAKEKAAKRAAAPPPPAPVPTQPPLLPIEARPRAHYSAGEISALNDAYRGARPLKRKSPVIRRIQAPAPPKSAIDPQALAADREARERLGALVAGDVRFEVQTERDGLVQALRQGASRKLLTAVQGSHFAPDATLDLHGFRASEAATRVHDFVRGEHKRGARRLLIIVGKGSHSEDGSSVLGPVARDALTRSGAAPLVQAFASAHSALGGRGALAVLLR